MCVTHEQERQCTYERNNRACSRNHLCSGKAISITYFECVSAALVIQHAMRMRRIMLPSFSCPALPYFPTLSHKRHDFEGNPTVHKMRVLKFSTIFFSKTFLILRRTERDKMSYRSSCKVPFVLADFNEIRIFSTDFRIIFKYQISRKCVQWEPSCSCGRTDRHEEANNRFSQFCERASKWPCTRLCFCLYVRFM